MNNSWSIFAGILIFNAITALAIAFILTRRPQKNGIKPLTLMFISLAFWSFGYAMITLSPQLKDKIFWLKFENFGIQTTALFWFLFAMMYTKMDSWMDNKIVLLALWVPPAVALTFILSDRWFHLYYSSVKIATEAGGPLLIERGPFYIYALVCTYTLYLAGLAALVRRFLVSRDIYRSQTPYLIGAVIIPFSLNIVYQVNPGILPIFPAPVDLTALAFTFTAAFLATSIFGLRLLDLVPIARDNVIESIPEMVFVLDDKERIIDANAVAQQWLEKPFAEILGKEPIEVFQKWPQLLQRFFFMERTREEIEIPGDPPRTLETIITPIYNRTNQLEGRVILAYDITDRKKLEKDLKDTNESLQAQLQENERLRVQLQEQAIRDPLTGVFNRRYLAEALDKETARAVREKSPFSLIVLDVDFFKKVNDTYGHKCGDLVLQSLAKFLQENTRRSDIVCRFGGEEFVILMPDAAVEDAYERAERFRNNFALQVVEHEGKQVKSTFSAGVASFPVHANVGETLLSMADLALYQSKANGRNRVTVFSPEIEEPAPAK